MSTFADAAKRRCGEPAPLRDRNTKFSIPDFTDGSRLANRSLGHALGPAAILFALGYRTSSPEVIHLMTFFHNYLASRQLNDDMHDWEDDLRRGQINAVGAMILQSLHAQGHDIPLNISNDTIQGLQELFWYDVVPIVCKRVLGGVTSARQALQDLTIIKDQAGLEQLLAPVEQIAHTTLKEQAETIKFLRAYAG